MSRRRSSAGEDAEDVAFLLSMAGLFLLSLLSVQVVGLVLVLAMLPARRPAVVARPVATAAAVAVVAPTPYRLGLPLVVHGPDPTATETPTVVATATQLPTLTPIPTWTPTAVPVVAAPVVAPVLPTWTPVPATATWTPMPTATETVTAVPTATATPMPTVVHRVEPVPSTGGSVDDPFVCTDGCADAPDPACPIKGNVNSKGDRIYHVPGSRDYERTDIKPEEGDQWFCSEADAEAAGFRAPRNQ